GHRFGCPQRFKTRTSCRRQRLLIQPLRMFGISRRCVTREQHHGRTCLYAFDQRRERICQPGAVCHCSHADPTRSTCPALSHQHGGFFVCRGDIVCVRVLSICINNIHTSITDYSEKLGVPHIHQAAGNGFINSHDVHPL